MRFSSLVKGSTNLYTVRLCFYRFLAMVAWALRFCTINKKRCSVKRKRCFNASPKGGVQVFPYIRIVLTSVFTLNTWFSKPYVTKPFFKMEPKRSFLLVHVKGLFKCQICGRAYLFRECGLRKGRQMAEQCWIFQRIEVQSLTPFVCRNPIPNVSIFEII